MFEGMWKLVSEVFSSIPDWVGDVLLFLLPFYALCTIFRVFFRVFCGPSSIFGLSLSDLHLKRRFTNLLCKSDFGFKIAYTLGWAERGIHFFDCGQDCHICPKKDSCDHSCS